MIGVILDVEDGRMLKSRWLGQKLPKVRVRYSTAPSGQRKYPMYAPSSVNPWKNFSQEAQEYASDEVVPGVKLLSDEMLSRINRNTVTNNTSAIIYMEKVLDYLGQCEYKWTLEFDKVIPENWLDSARDGAPDVGSGDLLSIAGTPANLKVDIAVMDQDRVILPVEMKSPTTSRGEGSEAVNLVESYTNPAAKKHGHLAGCVRQLMGFMVNLELGYGILSSAEFTYFARRVKANGGHHSSLEISEAISAHSEKPTLLEALFYILVKSMTQVSKAETYTFEPTVASDHDKDAAEDDSPKRKAKKGRKTVFPAEARRSSRIKLLPAVDYSGMQHTAAADLHLERRPYSSGGWSGNIVRGSIDGRQVAVKMAHINTPKAEALLKEMTAYKMLESYWGIYLPELIKYGTTANGKLVFIAIEFINGSEIWRKAPSQAEMRAAEEGLTAIHSSGLLHGDIHGGNIMVGEVGVRFIDFGFSKAVNNQADCSKELNQLKTIWQKCISIVTQS